MTADLARKRARQQSSPTHPLRLDPSWETNPESTTLLWTCQTCEGLSLPPPWLKRTNERCAAGKPTDRTGKQELDRCWSGTGLESPVSEERHRERHTERHRETQRDTERHRETQRATERHRETQRERFISLVPPLTQQTMCACCRCTSFVSRSICVTRFGSARAAHLPSPLPAFGVA